ncbi:pyridoxal-dependent decarboxylase domain-containing protein 1 isoform X2 [Bicyclus anynana]|uniref:Pyridoxal-dependent decarboxylase domain-containing protein 1 n=1 Tax=Bicyclus anynana TaxID=110368 RepID=A0ABM3LM60_BICAN|nr:pyridoxal-dependent decarboxylase domain-containing protein 1 isoform X2 [Bicyclus anynana]
MEDPPASEMDSKNPNAEDEDRRPFGGLEFQVSEVVGRLEAVVNAQDGVTNTQESVIDAQDSAANYPEFFESSNKEPPKEIPSDLELDETPMDEILKVLEDIVMKTDPNCESLEPPLLPTDAVTRAAILSHSISALFARLERGHAAKLGGYIASETTRWMSYLFRLEDYNAYYHQEQLEGLVRVTKMLLHHKYPRYLEDGALAFANRLPCIYSCVASPLGVVQHLCRQLGLPLACVRPVPADAAGRTDVPALERLCAEDARAGRAPLLVLGEAGAPPLGRGEPLRALARACAALQLHLHVRGHALALPAALPRGQTHSIADSLTLTPGPWFGVPGLPTVTFYKIPETVTANDHSKGVNPAGSRESALAALAGLTAGAARLAALPLWTCARAAGEQRLTRRIVGAFRSARAARALVASADLRLLSEPPGGDEPPNVDIVDAMSQASACVVFQFAPADCGARVPPYYDKLNSWLGQVLQREPDMMSVEVCETEAHGAALRYCPLEGAAGGAGADEAGAAWAGALEAQLHVLRATVALREPFRRSVRAHPRLALARVPGWAGLGGVRYEPAGWARAPRAQQDALQRSLVGALRAADGAFSCGAADDGRACVRFGMVTADTDVDELLALVADAGRAAEAGARALDDMTALVKRGISAAQEELARAADEGLLRRVPVVGRVVAWWAPPAPPAGRRLLLADGSLQTTEDIYRRVQKKEEEPPRAHSPSRAPPDDQ